ncbi:MAG: hypothetical protein IPQ07_45695 [Myxococcales bacterium]|nr:hypothetical protein [Myxococcales bacterium]
MEREFIPVNVAVLTVRIARTLKTDTSGRVEDGCAIVAYHVVYAWSSSTSRRSVIRRAASQAWIADPGDR